MIIDVPVGTIITFHYTHRIGYCIVSYLESRTDFMSLSGDLRESLGKPKSKQVGIRVGEDKIKEYRMARAEVLRKLYEENPVKEEKVLLYEHPSGDGRKNIYQLDAVEENPYSPFDDLEALEEKMPRIEDMFPDFF